MRTASYQTLHRRWRAGDLLILNNWYKLLQHIPAACHTYFMSHGCRYTSLKASPASLLPPLSSRCLLGIETFFKMTCRERFSGWLAGGWRREEIRRHEIVKWKEPKELTEGYNLSPIFWPIFVYILETSMCILASCSCLQCNPGCTYSYDWITLIRNKTKMWLFSEVKTSIFFYYI